MGPEILGDRRKVLGDLCTLTIQKIESMNNLPLEGGRKSDLTPSYLLSGGRWKEEWSYSLLGAEEGGRKSDLTPSYLLPGGAEEGGRKSDLTPSYLLCGGVEKGGRKSDVTPSYLSSLEEGGRKSHWSYSLHFVPRLRCFVPTFG